MMSNCYIMMSNCNLPHVHLQALDLRHMMMLVAAPSTLNCSCNADAASIYIRIIAIRACCLTRAAALSPATALQDLSIMTSACLVIAKPSQQQYTL